jgi:uncharacterized membrane protein
MSNPYESPRVDPGQAKANQRTAGLVLANIALFFALLSLIAWCVPILGLLVALIGGTLSVVSLVLGGRTFPIIVLCLSFLGATLSIGYGAFSIYFVMSTQETLRELNSIERELESLDQE